MGSHTRAKQGSETERLAREIAIQAELLALNIALEGKGAGQASEALYALSREIGRVGPSRLAAVPKETGS